MDRKPKVSFIPATKMGVQLKRVAVYARVSTAGKAQLQSLAVQISGLTRHVSNRNDCLLKDIYMDVGSAKTGADRREFTRLLNDCKNHELDYVITKSLSRFGRDNVEVLEAVRLLMASGVKIYFMEDDYESSASALIDEINWPEPQDGTGMPVPEQAREINWPEPER